MQNHDPMSGSRYIGRSGYTVASAHSHFPDRPLKVLHIGFVYLGGSFQLDQPYDAEKAGNNIGGKRLKFDSDAIV